MTIKCVGDAVSSGGRSVEVTTPGSVDEIWLALVEQINLRQREASPGVGGEQVNARTRILAV